MSLCLRYANIIVTSFGRNDGILNEVFLVKLGYSITFTIIYPIPEDCSLLIFFSGMDGFLEHLGEAQTLEDIVTKNETGRIFTDKIHGKHSMPSTLLGIR